MTNIHTREEHEYTFWTDAFGVKPDGSPIKVNGKEHYKKLMAQGGMVPMEVAQRIAEETKNDRERKVKKGPSKRLESFLRHLYMKPQYNGKVRFGGREIEAMKEMGVDFTAQVPEYLKNKHEGGFCNS